MYICVCVYVEKMQNVLKYKISSLCICVYKHAKIITTLEYGIYIILSYQSQESR